MGKKSFFVYPVLTPDHSSYIDECFFTIKDVKQEVKEKEITIYYDWELKCELLQQLINNNKAKIWIVLESEYVSLTNEIDLSNKTIRIETDELLDTDSLSIHLEIVALDDFNIQNNGELNDRYKKDVEFDINKGDILAESDSLLMRIRRGANSMFIFDPRPEMEGKGISFVFKDEVIRIMVGETLLASLVKLKQDSKEHNYYKLCVRMILQQAITSSLIELSERSDQYEESRWKDEYDFVCRSVEDMSIDEIIDANKDEKSKLNDVAQMLLSNMVDDQIGIEDMIIKYTNEEM